MTKSKGIRSRPHPHKGKPYGPRKADAELSTRYRKVLGQPAHRRIVEQRIGMKLPDYAIVHHVNPDDKLTNNGPFVVCQDNAYHQLLETRGRALRECGNANWKKCRKCHRWDDPANMQQKDVQVGKSGFMTKYWHYRWKGQCVNKGDRCETRTPSPRVAPLYRGGQVSPAMARRLGPERAAALAELRRLAWADFLASDSPVVTGSEEYRCKCGSLEGKRYGPTHYHCINCGRQKHSTFKKAAQSA